MMTLKEAMNKAAKKYPGGVSGMKRALNKPPSFSNRFVESSDRHQPSAQDVVDVVNLTGNPLPIQVLAHMCGGVFIQLPKSEFPTDLDVVDGLAEYERDKGETMGKIATAMRAPRITVRHASEIIREGYEDFNWLNTLGGHIYMMAEDREEHPAMVTQWERLTMESVSS